MGEGGREHLAVIYNPTAGGARGARFAAVVAALREAGCRVDLHNSTSAADVKRLAAVLSHGDHQALVVAGGDGTINDAVNGLVPDSAMPFGILPLGTANVLAWEIGLAKADPGRLAAALRFGPFLGRYIWAIWSPAVGVGRSARHGRGPPLFSHGGRGLRCVGGPRGQSGAEAARRKAGLHLGNSATALPQPLSQLRGGDRRPPGGGLASVVVAKARHYGGHYVCAAEADLADPGFQVCLFRRRGGISVLRYAVALERGTLCHGWRTSRRCGGGKSSITAPEGCAPAGGRRPGRPPAGAHSPGRHDPQFDLSYKLTLAPNRNNKNDKILHDTSSVVAVPLDRPA